MISIRHLVASAAAAVCLFFPAIASAPVVNAPAGTLQGQSEDGLNVFKGIPYAMPPVGPLRWKPPVEMPRWNGVKQATQYGNACMQPVSKGPPTMYTADPGPLSEDCLVLNVWAPAGAKNLPVFFYIHGGNLVGGSGHYPVFSGSKMAARGIVVVTINYRLGVLGYLAHPELSAESPLGISGNYGLLDQIEALKWVKRNIASFGGDAANVTIAGQSAGALSVEYLMASPMARGLFAKAIAESGYMFTAPDLKQTKFGTPSAEQLGVNLAAALHVSDIKALRAMDARQLVDSSLAAGYPTAGTIDGHILLRQLADTFAKGEQAPVPLMAGLTSGEVRSLPILLPPKPAASAAEYESIIRDRYQDLAGDFLRLYPSSNMQESTLAAIRDAVFSWPMEKMVKSQTALGQPAYLYYWDHGYPAADAAGVHASHSAEIPYMFGTLDHLGPYWPKMPNSPQEWALSDAVIGYWTSFARSGHPEAANAPAWSAYGTTAAYMDFQDVPKPAKHFMPGMYRLMDEVACRRHANDQPWLWTAGISAPKVPPQAAACR
jgi:para-nitrobenzyl esterase